VLEFQIHYPAVTAAAFATMVLGAVWYAPPLFGNAWLQAHGFSDEQATALRKDMGRTSLISLVCYLVMAFVLAVIAATIGVTTASQGALLGGFMWLGFLATMGMTAQLFSQKSITVYLIDGAYQLVYCVLMGVIIAVWR